MVPQPGDQEAIVVPDSTPDSTDERRDLLLLCTEPKRLARADRDARRVQLQVQESDLYIAAVSAYNVVIDLRARRVQHGCRDFLAQAREGKLCKHVAALLLAMEPAVALGILRQLTDPDGGWHLEVIAARGFGRTG